MATSALSARSAAVTISRDGLPAGSPPAGPSPGTPSLFGCMGLSAPCARRRGWLARTVTTVRRGSVPREGGLPRPILDETAHSRALTPGRAQASEVPPRDCQTGAELGVQAVVEGLLRGPEGPR